jgi:hypothetical protein
MRYIAGEIGGLVQRAAVERKKAEEAPLRSPNRLHHDALRAADHLTGLKPLSKARNEMKENERKVAAVLEAERREKEAGKLFKALRRAFG